MTNYQEEQGAELNASTLTEKRLTLWSDRFPEDDGLALRIHRAISWIGRAERETDDYDAAFAFYWIAFNAAYAQDIRSTQDTGERDRLREYFNRLVHLDSDRRVFNAVWHRFSDSVRVLLDNKFVFQPFWNYHNGVEGYADWESRFQASKSVVAIALGSSDTETILSTLFDRLYVLRNQIIHGGATWGSSVNREQVRDGARILSFLVPVFIDIMMDNLKEQWGPPYYPVV